MTGLLHEKEFSRKSFVKAGGALIIGFSVAGATFAGKASPKFQPLARPGGLQSRSESGQLVDHDQRG